MNIPSFYQNDLFNELVKKFDEFEVIYAHLQDENRVIQGWKFDDFRQYKSNTIGQDLNLLDLIFYVSKNRKATHIVNGIWAEKSFLFVLILLNVFKANFLIYSEAPIHTKKRNFITKMLLNFVVKPLAKLLIMRAKGFLAVSIFAVEYFESLDINDDKIYRFGYFRNVNPILQNQLINKTIQLIFVGQLIERKGIMSLLNAIKIVSESSPIFHLTIIGTGELQSLLKEFISKNQLQNKVTLLGVINSENIIEYIKKADLLILPSIFDGWGLVINEALQSNVPVLISDKCGAKELVKHNQNGLIFKYNNVESLTENLQKFLSMSLEERVKMKQFTDEMKEKISIPIVSDYLVLCIEHCLKPQDVKPVAPWLND